MVYLVKDNGTVRAFYSEGEMTAAGFALADKTVTDEEFNGNGCYARIIDDEIIVGRTEDEIAAEEKQEAITAIDAQLADIDRRTCAGRSVRELLLTFAESAGTGGQAVDNLSAAENEAEGLRQARESLTAGQQLQE